MKKRLLSIGLILAMAAGMLTGCGSTQESENQGSSVAEASAEEESDDEIVTIKARLLNNQVTDEGAERVKERLNELTEEKIGVHVDVEFLDFSVWNEQINTMIAGGEVADVISLSPMFTIEMLEKQNALMDITSLLEEYAPETMELMDDLLITTTKDGKIYGVPKLSDMDQIRTIFMREDILEEMGMLETAQNITSWSELEELLLAVKEAYPDMTPMFVAYNAGSTPGGAGDDTSSDLFAENSNLDVVGDPYKFVYVDADTGEIGSFYESDEYEEMVSRMDRWYKEGLVYADGALTEMDTTTAMTNGDIFCYMGQGKSDIEVAASEMEGWTGQDLVALQLYRIYPQTTTVNMFGFAVPYTSTEPEAAVKFINLLMTDPEVINLLSYGEEGTDYVLEDGVAKYPEGVDATSVGYHSQSFLFGSELLAYPWDGTTPETLEASLEFYQNGMPTQTYFGFTADLDDLSQEVTACYNATLEYRATLECGGADDWEQLLADFRAKLKSSGIDQIVEAYQQQASAWLESNQ